MGATTDEVLATTGRDYHRSAGRRCRVLDWRLRLVARFSGHRTAAVFKRYNIVEEQDLKAVVALLNRTRKEAEEVQATEAAPGPDSVSVDGT
jgi:hypothetical protein